MPEPIVTDDAGATLYRAMENDVQPCVWCGAGTWWTWLRGRARAAASRLCMLGAVRGAAGAEAGDMKHTRPAPPDDVREACRTLGEAATICQQRLVVVELQVLKARSAGDRVAARRLSREARERNRTLRSLYDAREMLRGGWA
jgi:hypothetical protein